MAFSEQTNPHAQPQQKNSRDRILEATGDPNNPFGIGDPNDTFLRKVEKEIMIPMKMRERSKVEKCSEVVRAFTECSKAAGILMVAKCRTENKQLKACLTRWYNDEEFKKECTEMYLIERAEYRRTGIKKKDMQRYLA